jgi:hypothetical protein
MRKRYAITVWQCAALTGSPLSLTLVRRILSWLWRMFLMKARHPYLIWRMTILAMSHITRTRRHRTGHLRHAFQKNPAPARGVRHLRGRDRRGLHDHRRFRLGRHVVVDPKRVALARVRQGSCAVRHIRCI